MDCISQSLGAGRAGQARRNVNCTEGVVATEVKLGGARIHCDEALPPPGNRVLWRSDGQPGAGAGAEAAGPMAAFALPQTECMEYIG
jgi:hypothetical protein